ncbi:MAG: DNA primase [Thiohalocapsa sp.]|jgi:DNA primase|uniref:DNA primase n=1 Tax=Thiohalocapsa sp. TaxID=2497641 RepID=UPI0025D75AD4|nr:DNA primase [Thiohalocapsa sp.]MCG6943107.1 DNA primase [Thiohalocapsa sp.]
MVGRITPELKDQLLARTDIVEVVGLRVPLRKAGALFKACCPFHTEKTPSFVVTPARQTYHCFGCGAHGNAIDFLIEFDRLSFPEAVEELAQRAGMPLPEAGDAPRGPDPKPLYALLEQAASLYRQALREHPERAAAVAYLERRGLSGEIVQRYGLGLAPPGWSFLLDALGKSAEQCERLVAAGLLSERDGRRYDRFRGRIMFPIRDRRGRVVGFGGRVLDDGEPKYLNSPETPVFVKGRELYGLYESQQALRNPPRLLLVEGYMDVIALSQFGIDYAVAALGTAATPEHIKRLLRGAPEVVFCFDGDKAGRDAAWKALKTALPLATGQQPLRFLFLPEGEDPDTLVRKEGQAAFEARLANGKLLSAFLFEHAGASHDVAAPEGRAGLADEVRGLLAGMPAGSYRDQLAGELARRIGEPVPRGGAMPRRAAARPAAAAVPSLSPLRRAIALLLDDPGRAALVADKPADWRELDNPGVRLLAEVLDIARAYPGITSASLVERWRGTEDERTVRRLADARLIELIPEAGRGEELAAIVDRLNKDVAAERRAAEIQRRWRERGVARGDADA